MLRSGEMYKAVVARVPESHIIVSDAHASDADYTVGLRSLSHGGSLGEKTYLRTMLKVTRVNWHERRLVDGPHPRHKRCNSRGIIEHPVAVNSQQGP